MEAGTVLNTKSVGCWSVSKDSKLASVSLKNFVFFAIAVEYYFLNWLVKFQPDGSFILGLFFQLFQGGALQTFP